MLIDAHCHLDLFDDKKKIVNNAREANVGIILANGINPQTNRIVLELAREYKEVKAVCGIYPIDCLGLNEKEIDEEIKFIIKNKEKIIAIGEVGIDLKESSDLDRQKKNFIKFIELAMKLDKPVVVHSRKAEEDCIEILEEMNVKKVVMHCFSGKKKLAQRIIKNGWTLTIPTAVKNSVQFQDTIKITPIEQLLCETDSPFLHPDKKFPNEPANVVESYKKISEIKKLSLKEVETQLEKNYRRMFNKI